MQRSSEPDEDDALIAKIAYGDESALQNLCASYHVRLWKYLWRQLNGNREMAEEALQDEATEKVPF